MPQWKKAYHANCGGALGGAPVGVTSIKDLFYRTFGDMNRAIADIGQSGYEGVELFDGNLVDYEGKGAEFASTYRMRVWSSWPSTAAETSFSPRFYPKSCGGSEGQRTWALLGAQHLVVEGGAQRTVPATDEDYGRLADALNQVADLAKQRGLVAHYHPHPTTMAETPEQIGKVFSRSGSAFVRTRPTWPLRAVTRRD
jgi:inosose dehydratase